MKINKEKIVRKAASITSRTLDAVEAVTDKAEDAANNTKDKFEEFMAKPEVVATKENIAEAAENASETVKKTARTIRTKIADVIIQEAVFGEGYSVNDIERAVKADAAERRFKGDIQIYINLAEKTAYYTVNGDGDDTMKVDLKALKYDEASLG